VNRFARRLEPLMPSGAERTLEGCWDLGGTSFTARLAGIRGSGCLRHRFGRLRARDVIDVWVQHLVLCLAAEGAAGCESIMVCTDQTLRLAPVAESRAALEGLLRLYRRGIEMPLAFFPESSLAYARGARRSETRAMAAARSAWEGSDRHPGECANAYYQRCFEAADPLGEEFVRLSRSVFDPVLDCALFEKA
jgi:exodeoxyribonuclease V gamma subunit